MPRVTPLKVAIAKRGVLQADLAEIIGVSESRISRLANGRAKPSAFEVKKIAAVLGVLPEEIQGSSIQRSSAPTA